MKYTEFLEGGVSDAQKQEFLVSGEPTAITIRIPKNLKDAGAEAAQLSGISFSAFIRMCMLQELTKKG